MKPFEQVLSLCGRIPPDKLAHALGGATFTVFACPALYYLGDPTYLLTSLLAVMCVGLFKEVYDALFLYPSRSTKPIPPKIVSVFLPPYIWGEENFGVGKLRKGGFRRISAYQRAKHSVELWDALATLCGGLMPLMPIVLIR